MARERDNSSSRMSSPFILAAKGAQTIPDRRRSGPAISIPIGPLSARSVGFHSKASLRQWGAAVSSTRQQNCQRDGRRSKQRQDLRKDLPLSDRGTFSAQLDLPEELRSQLQHHATIGDAKFQRLLRSSEYKKPNSKSPSRPKSSPRSGEKVRLHH